MPSNGFTPRPAMITEDASNTREALARLETDLRAISGGFSSYRDDVASLKLQQGHQQTEITRIATDVKSDMMALSTSFRSEIDKISVQISMVVQKIDGRRVGTGAWVSIAGVVIVFVGMFMAAAAFFVNAEIANATASQTQALAALSGLPAIVHELELSTSRSTQADARSETDRNDLNRRMGKLENDVATEVAQRREDSASFRSSSVEIETQFKSITQQLYYLWAKVMGDPYPIMSSRETPVAK
jgi:septal ring factor EnvC (AmiA/AmiB activator)